MKKLLLIAVVLVAGYFGGVESGFIPGQGKDYGADTGAQVLASAFNSHRSDFQIQGSGRVVRILADDDDGSRHQRFIIETASGQTLLMAHNIDLAPRIAALEMGDRVEFNGEYAWNAKGGVIHWTHHDPQGRHVSGWIKHGGQLYQ